MNTYDKLFEQMDINKCMTDKEDMHSCAFLDDIEGGVLGAIPNYIDWLSSNHLDYRGLIDKGLALPAKDGMY